METTTKANWKLGAAAVLVCVLLIVLLTEGVLIPKQLQPDVLPIRLLSVTTTENVKQAIYELRNESGSKVDVWGPVSLNVGKPDDFESLHTQITPLSIDDRQAATIPVTVPHDQAWQVVIRVARHGARRGTVVISDWSTGSQQ